MKRSKKAGGYNLRKSLAWDRAFFTEEGVLNDSELSLISGNIDGTDSLSVIDEHGKDSMPANNGTANLETLEVDLFKELPSGYPNKRNATCGSPMKQDSLSSGSLTSASKSTQKVAPPSHGLKKAVCKGEVCSSPMTSVSQKRLSNTGTKPISTRNSKIPKVSVLKKNSSVPSVTTIHSAAGGSSLIPQPARKSLSSKLSSKVKHTSNAAISSLESVSKYNKPAADFKNDVVNSALQRHSLMSQRAPNTTKVSKCSENSSSQGLLSGVAGLVKSTDETSSTAALSHVQFDNADLRKNVQVQGLKPSGLRMPSPSLRFFSETKIPASNTLSQVNSKLPNLLESTISTSRKSEVADRNHDFKHTQLLHGAPDVDVMGKAGLCSQKTDKCSTSLIVAPKMHSGMIQKNCNQQAIEVQTLGGDKTSESTKDEQSRCDYHDTFEMKYEGQVSISLQVEEEDSKDSKDSKSVCSDIEFEEPSYNKDSILLQENRSINRSEVDEFHESCPEAQLVKPCETIAEIQSQQLEVEVNSTAVNNDATLESQTNSISHYDNLMLAPDSNPSSRIVDDNRTPDNDLDQTNSERSMKEQVAERNLLVNDKSSIKVVEEGSAFPVCTDNVMADSKISGVTDICNANCSIAGDLKFECVDDEQDEVIYDCKSPTMKLSESSEMQDKEIDNHDIQQRTSANYDTKEICAANLEVVEMSSHCASTLPELLNEVPVKIDYLGDSDQGERQSQSSRCGISGDYGSVLGASIASNQDTKTTKDSFAEADKQQVLNKKLLAKEMTLQKNEADLNHSTVSEDSSYRIGQSNNHIEDVQDQIDLLSCLSNNGNESTPKITHLEFQSSGLRCKDQLVVAVANSDPEEYQCPVNSDEISPQEVLMGKTFDECIVSAEQGCNLSPREARLNVSQHVENITDERTCNTEAIDNEDAATKQMTENQKSTRPPPNVVPFSDEWLAVIESAGEEILTLKTGPVKHSPPDKSTLEPSPWSPVKRVIGPFDCTKYTNAQPDNIN